MFGEPGAGRSMAGKGVSTAKAYKEDTLAAQTLYANLESGSVLYISACLD